MSKRPSDPSVTQQVRLDAICMQFELACRHDEKPRIEAFVDSASKVELPRLLRQLLLLELEYAEKAGAPPNLEEYLERFTDQQTVVRHAFVDHAEALQQQGHFDKHGVALRAASPAALSSRDGTIDHQPTSEPPGSIIGRYKLLEQIGEGGMGVVYMAEQHRPVRRKVALKIIKPGMDTRQVVARFEAERQALAMMDHPNIARVLDAGSTESGRPYFVMELVRGVSITEYCNQTKRNTVERLNLFKLVCQAVQHAHTKGIIHRDLKPTNVLVTLHDGEPVPKIIDFGVSKAMGQQLTEKTMFTAFAQMVGTPLYMSPEQAEMSGLDVDTRSDIYSLGVLLYELLTGVTPFDRKRLHTAAFDELRRIIREEEPEKPSTRVSSLGESSVTVSTERSTDPSRLRQLLRGELDWIVMKALEKDRNRRYETANALVAEINRYLKGEPVEACPPSATYRIRKFARRHRSQVAVASGFILLLLTSSAVSWLLYVDARRARNDAIDAKAAVTVERDRAIDAQRSVKVERDRAESERDRAENERLRANQHANELKTRLYDYNLIKAHAMYREDNAEGALALLDECLEQQRGWEWHHLQQLLGVQIEHPLEVAAQVLAVSPTAARLAVGDLEGGIRLLDETDGRELWQRSTGNRCVIYASFSPDGKYLAVTHANQNLYATVAIDASTRGGLQLRETATGRLVWEKSLDPGAFGMVEFSPNGRQLIVWSGSRLEDVSIELRHVDTGAEIWSAPAVGLPMSMVFSPDGERLFLSQWSQPDTQSPSTLDSWSVADHASLWSISRDVSSQVAITVDGSRLITGGSTHSLQVWDASTGEQLEERIGELSDTVESIDLSRDGKMLVSRGYGGITIWDWRSRQPLRTYRKPITGPGGPTLLSSDDNYLVSLDAMPGVQIQYLEVNPQPPQLTLSGHEGAVRGVAFTPDGKQVVSAGFDGTIRTWNAMSGQEVHTKAIGGSLMAVVFSPTGAHYATGSDDAVCLWNAETNELVRRWPETDRARSVQFSPNGQRLITAIHRTGRGLKLFDVADGRQIMGPEIPKAHTAIFSPDGRRAVSILHDDPPGLSGQIDLWDLDSSGGQQTIRPATGQWGHGLIWLPHPAVERGDVAEAKMPSSERIAAAIDNTIEIWNVDTKQPVTTLSGHNAYISCLAVNRDGTRLFSGDLLGVVRVWNLRTSEELFTIKAHEVRKVPHWGIPRGVMSISLSPDEKTLATTGADGLVKLWETRRPSRALTRQREMVHEATQLVNQLFGETPALRDVMTALSDDKSLSREVLQLAIDIANARGDRESTGGWEKLYSLGIASAAEGRWQDATVHLATALRLAPEKSETWHETAYRLAFLLAYTDQFDRYDQLCQEMVAAFGSTDEPALVERTVKACLFSSRATKDLFAIGELADRAYKDADAAGTFNWKGKVSYQPYLALAKGIADIRRGRLDSAIEALISAQAFSPHDRYSVCARDLYLGIAYARTGQHDLSAQRLAAADTAAGGPPLAESKQDPTWSDWILVQIARREAEDVAGEVVRGAKPPATE